MRQMHDRGHTIDLVCACPQMLAGLWGGGERRAVFRGVIPETSEETEHCINETVIMCYVQYENISKDKNIASPCSVEICVV